MAGCFAQCARGYVACPTGLVACGCAILVCGFLLFFSFALSYRISPILIVYLTDLLLPIIDLNSLEKRIFSASTGFLSLTAVFGLEI